MSHAGRIGKIKRIKLLPTMKEIEMNAKTENENWYYNGAEHNLGNGIWGIDALEDYTEEEKLEMKAFVEKFNSEAPAGFKYLEKNDDQPFGAWERHPDEFGGTYVVLLPANPSDAIPEDREFPAGLSMWIYVNLGTEFADLTPNWDNVDTEIRETFEAWNQQ